MQFVIGDSGLRRISYNFVLVPIPDLGGFMVGGQMSERDGSIRAPVG